ncbi:Annexin D5 [Vitis vinifera]|uniref:Annexin n=1 Tax=Vitis vinifera TaxID=29760 RepID=A0A438DGF9_VITVI|nr:Annexin D5 [Vitis vinifera]
MLMVKDAQTFQLKSLLLAYVRVPRYEGPEVDRAMVEKDAKALYKAGEKKLGTDENTFIRIFSEKSRAHLAAVSTAYHSVYGNSLQKAVKSETSGHFEFALLTILQSAENSGSTLQRVGEGFLFVVPVALGLLSIPFVLHKAMKGLGTDDTTLTRIIVTRAEIDLQYIKQEYRKKYGKTLNDAVHSETSGHYKAFLLALLGPNH